MRGPKMKAETRACIAEFVRQHGEDTLARTLSAHLDKGAETYALTIICNKGTHALPQLLIRGEEFVLSQGDIDMSSATMIEREMHQILARLATKLKEKNWQNIYIVPSGHPILFAYAKLLVFRVTRIESVDSVYLGHGAYTDIHIEQRPLITAT
jgi:hypothetical protein